MNQKNVYNKTNQALTGTKLALTDTANLLLDSAVFSIIKL